MEEFTEKIIAMQEGFRELLGSDPINPDKLRALHEDFNGLIANLCSRCGKYVDGHQDGLHMLEKVEAQRTIEALERQFLQRYGHAFNAAFPNYRTKGVYYSRPKMWRWVLHHDQMCHGGALHNVATDNGNLKLTIRQAVEHIVQYYHWRSDLVRHEEFSRYQNTLVFHQEILEKGYDEGKLPFNPRKLRHFTMNCDDSARILTGLSVHACFDPKTIEFLRK